MTIMRVSYVGAQLAVEKKQELASRLIEAFARVEVGQSNPAVHGGFLVHFEAVDATDLYVGDAPMAKASEVGRSVLVTTQVMAGPWTDEMKSEIFGEVETVLRDALDMPRKEPGSDFWMTITEVPEGGWGYGGRPASIAALAPVFTEDRQARIRDYLSSR